MDPNFVSNGLLDTYGKWKYKFENTYMGPNFTRENQMKETSQKSVKISSIRSNVDH